MAENIEDGIVKASITINGPFGMDFMSQTTHYTGRLLENSALMISGKLDDCFVINRKAMQKANISNIVSVDVNGTSRNLAVTPLSIILFKQWSEKQVIATDIIRLANTKTATISLLKPFLYSDDIQLKAAAVSTLSTLKEPDAKSLVISFLDDPITLISAAAIDACRLLKIDSVHNKVIPLLTISEAKVRIAAVRYLASFPTDLGKAAIEIAEKSEMNTEMKKEIAKVQKIFRR